MVVPRLGSLKKENKKLLISQFAELRNVGVASLSDSVVVSLEAAVGLSVWAGVICRFGAVVFYSRNHSRIDSWLAVS